MQKIMSHTIDSIGRGILIFSLAFVWLRYYISNLYLCIAICLIMTIFVCSLLDALIFGRSHRANHKLSLEHDIDGYMYSLMMMDGCECAEFFLAGLKTLGASISNDMIVNGTVGLIPIFYKPHLELYDIIKPCVEAKRMGLNKVVILCNEYDGNVPKMDALDVSIMTREEVYLNVLNKYDFYPPIDIKIEHKKFDLKKVYNIVFKPAKAIKYALCGLLMFFCSYFVFIKVYYLVFGSLLLVFALICLYNRKHIKRDTKENIWD